MPQASHTFARSNFDDSDEARPSSDFREATNISLESGQAFPTTGNAPVFSLFPPVAGVTLSLGCIEEEANDTAVVFYYNSEGAHRLVRYNPAGAGGDGEETLILEWAGLNLAPELVLQGRVIQGILVYRDAKGNPRAVNLARAEAGVYTPAYLAAEPYALHLVKVPPSVQPTAKRETSTTGDERDNFRLIQTKAYQFAYRWHDIDGGVTPMSNLSNWCDILENPSTTTLNVIVVTLPGTVPNSVVSVDVLVREADTAIWQIAATLRRSDAGVLPSTFRFYGQLLGGALSESETTKLAEACWPCEALEVAGSRVFEANILEGYPTPEPTFTAVVQSGNAGSQQGDLYTLDIEVFAPGEPSQNGEPVPDTQQALIDYFTIASGTFPDPSSTYYLVSRGMTNGQPQYMIGYGNVLTYDEAFNAPARIGSEISRSTSVSQVQFITPSDNTTFHERCAYRVGVQFYDALGQAYGVSQPQSVYIPKRTAGQLEYRSILATLTTTDTTKLNLEIPEGAYSYNFVVARNDQTVYFIQGEAADAFAFLGNVIQVRQDDSRNEYASLVDVTKNAHEKVWLDIGNFPATGQGYQWLPGSGDRVRLLRENQDFLITDQVGDYIEYASTDWPRMSLINGNSVPLIEIYSPNTSPSALYYERGPRLPVVRTLVGDQVQRSYSKTSVVIEGDCFLVPISFPVIIKSDDYLDDPSGNKSYDAAKSPTLVESMVPPFRLAPATTITKTIYDKRTKGGFFSYFFSHAFDLKGYAIADDPDTPANTTVESADASTRTAANLLWLDVSWGGRPAIVVPRELQQVRRNIIRHSNRKQQDNLINGLGSFEPLSFYDKLPQEQGAIVRMSVADQAQTDGSVLLVNQTQGATSLYLGQQPIQADPNNQLLTITDKVIGGENTLRGGFGCVDAGTVVPYAGVLFYYSRERRELVRYNKGLVPLGLQYKYRTRLEELARRYKGGRVTGCFDPNRQEYLLTFHDIGELPGKTVVWSERRQAWADAISFVPTAATGINAELLSWQNEQLYRHLPTAPVGTFFNAYTAPSLTFVPASGIAKTWQQVSVRSQAQWVPTLITTPAGQRSRILPSWMKFIQGVWRAAVRRDENSPGFSGDTAKALHGGRVLQSESASITLTCPELNPGPISGAAVDFLINTGQAPNQ